MRIASLCIDILQGSGRAGTQPPPQSTQRSVPHLGTRQGSAPLGHDEGAPSWGCHRVSLPGEGVRTEFFPDKGKGEGNLAVPPDKYSQTRVPPTPAVHGSAEENGEIPGLQLLKPRFPSEKSADCMFVDCTVREGGC